MKAAMLIPASGEAQEVQLPDSGSDELTELQRLVGGMIQYVPTAHAVTLYCNEEGKLENLPPNFAATKAFGQLLMPGDVLVGDVVVCGAIDSEGENTDLIDVPEWIKYVRGCV